MPMISAVTSVDPTTAALWEYQGRTGSRWTRLDIVTMVERVNRGATLLDEVKPGWNQEVLPDRLDMSSGAFCIVGQAFGNYGDWIGPVFGLDMTDDGNIDPLAIEHGFLTNDDEDIPWSLMDRVWGYLLTERSERGAPLTLTLPPQDPINIAEQRLIDAGLIAA